jgi:hypothetical protein
LNFVDSNLVETVISIKSYEPMKDLYVHRLKLGLAFLMLGQQLPMASASYS